MNPRHLKRSCNSRRNESSRDEILSYGRVKVKSTPGNRKWRGHDRTDHCEGVLEAEDDGEKDGDFIVEAIKWGDVVLVFAV